MKKFIGALTKNAENKELIKDSGFAFIIRALASVSFLSMNMVITRRLGAQQSGYFFLAFGILTVVATITRIGADNVILKYSSIYSSQKNWNKLQSVFRTIFLSTLFFSTVIGLAIMVFSRFISDSVFHKPGLEKPLFWMGLSIPFMATYTVAAYGLQGIKRVAASVALQNIVVPLLAIAGIYLIAAKTSASVSIVYCIASLFTVLTGLYWWRKYTQGNADEYEVKTLWNDSKQMWVVAILQLSVQWSGQFISGFYVASSDLAQLAVAQRVALLISFILIAINLVSAPTFASLYSQGKLQQLQKYAVKTTKLMTVVATPIVIIIMIFPGWVMSFFGKDFVDGALLLRIMALAQFINAITGSVQYLLTMSGHEKDVKNIAVVNSFVTLLLAIILIPKYGVIGAAIATAIGISTQNLMAFYMVKKRLGFSTILINFKRKMVN